jgi:uncharacterized membrane protein
MAQIWHGSPGMTAPTESRPPVPPHVVETVEAVAKLQARSEREVSRPQRSVEAFTNHLSRPAAVWAIAITAIAWITANMTLSSLGRYVPDPPPFEWMQGACSLGALLMTTAVLAAQHRQRSLAEEHAQLDLHVNLLAEQKVAKLIGLVQELRRDLPNVSNREDPLADAMTHALDPRAVASALRETRDVDPGSDSDTTKSIAGENHGRRP